MGKKVAYIFALGVVAAFACAAAAGLIFAKDSGAPKAKSSRLSKCHIGDPPPLDTTRIPAAARPERQLVIGCRTSRWHGSLELVGIETSQGLCFTADNPRYGDSQGGLCIPKRSDWRAICGGHPICVSPLSWSDGAGHGYSQIVGEMSPGIHHVDVVELHGPAVRGPTLTVVGRLVGKIGARLHVDKPIAFFSVVIAGCPPAEGVRVVGRSTTAGSVVGAAVSENTFPRFCAKAGR